MLLIFSVSLFLLMYTFVGYPLLLLLLKRTKGIKPRETDENYQPTVEVILIVRNVSQIIVDKIHSLQQLDYPLDKFKILIVSDQSEDDTASKIDAMKMTNVRCIKNELKSSKSACLNQAIAQSEAEVLFLTDARQTHEKHSLKELVKYFSDDSVGAVSGELIFRDPDTNDFAEGMDAYWRYEKFIRHNESQIASVPGVTGAVYAMRREYFESIPAETLLDDVLIPMNMVLKGKKVLFEPKAVAYDIPSADIEREKIRKTRTLAGNWQLLEFQPQLLNPFKNGIWLQFISHKILRLICPFLLLSILLSSALLASGSWLFSLVFYGQLAGYALVLSANYLPRLMNIKLIKMAHSFFILMWFTWLGCWSFFTRQHLTIWK